MKCLTLSLTLTATLALAGLAACKQEAEAPPPAPQASEAPAAAPAATPAATPAAPSADVTLQSQDPKVSGTIHFTQAAGGAQPGVHVVADVKGVKPGEHGFHLHEKGDCSTPDYKSAGGHFNPGSAPHACDPTNPRHAGDFGNITVDKDGNGHLDITTTALSFDGPNSLLGKAVILHAGKDDCKTQPTGNSGDRLACGVVSGGTGTTGGTAATGATGGMGSEPMGTEHH